jgi:DNA-binding response OmpR family regulator
MGAQHADGEPGKLVLVVDDDLGIMNLVFSTLEKRGYRVIGTKTARSALAVARTVKPDIVLMDLQMPGMDGFEGTRQLRADAATAAIPVLIVSASADEEDPYRALEAGADGFVAKPFDAQYLIDYVDKLTRAAGGTRRGVNAPAAGAISPRPS